jgi:hypothetical protein
MRKPFVCVDIHFQVVSRRVRAAVRLGAGTWLRVAVKRRAGVALLLSNLTLATLCGKTSLVRAQKNTPTRVDEADARSSHWGILLAQARAEVR